MDCYTHIPYITINGIPTMRDSQLLDLYYTLEKDGLIDLFLHDGSINNQSQWLAHVKNPTTLLWTLQVNGRTGGFCYFTNIDRAKAFCHFSVYKEFWGSVKTVPGGQYVMQEALKIFNTVMGMCPVSNILAVSFLKKIGLTHIMDVPNALWSKQEGKAVTGSLLYITREELDEDIQ